MPADPNRPSVSRRHALALAGLGAAGSIAGCLGGEDTDREGESVEDPGAIDEDGDGRLFVAGQEFKVASSLNPTETTFLVYGNWPIYHDSFNEPAQPDGMTEPAVWDLWRLQQFPKVADVENGDQLLESWSLDTEGDATADDPHVIEITIQSDARWSDGEPITAEDVMANVGIERLRVATDDDEEDSFFPSSGGDMRTDWDYLEFPDGPDGNRVRFVSEGLGPGLGETSESEFLESWSAGQLSLDSPAHVEPIDAMADAVAESLENALENPTDLDAWQTQQEIIETHLDEHHLEQWRNPDHVVTNGAWQLEDVRGMQGILLSPNPHHRNADEVNFDRVEVEYAAGEHRKRASLQNGLLDAAQISLSQEAIDNLPKKYTQIDGVGAGPGVIQFNHAHWAFQHVEVRQAIAYAIDQHQIAENVDPATTNPIEYPGAEVSNWELVWDWEEIEATFINYSQDQDRADELMRSVGFERNDDGVWVKDGRELSFLFDTPTEDPIYETTVADQLSQWGADVEVQPHEPPAFDERRDLGEFDFYTAGGRLNYHVGSIDTYWGTELLLHRDYIDRHNIYDREQMEAAVSNYPESGWVYDNWTDWENVSIDLPPVGEADGEKEPVDVTYIGARSTLGGVPRDENTGPRDEAFWDLMAWATNYYLPALPLYEELNLQFINTANFEWPLDHPLFSQYGFRASTGDLLSMALIVADTDNPKEGATLERRDE